VLAGNTLSICVWLPAVTYPLHARNKTPSCGFFIAGHTFVTVRQAEHVAQARCREMDPVNGRESNYEIPGSNLKWKENHMKMQLKSAVAATVLIVAPGIISAQEPLSNNLKPAHREEKASTVSIVAEDHLTLAGYFRDLASQEQALAESYEHIAALYKENAQHQGADPVPAAEMENQFRRLAEIERRAAKLTASLADYHGRLAEESRAPLRANPPFSSLGK
jgi:hypothetical protein